MHSNKLLQILTSFSAEDFRRLLKVCRSPFYTTNPSVVDLYRYLKRYYPTFDSPKLAKGIVFKKLFPTEKYSDIKLRNLFSEMTRMAEHCLIHLELEKDVFLKRKILVDIYGQKKLNGLSIRTVQKQEKELKALPYLDMDHYRAIYELNLQQLEILPSNALLNRFQLLSKTESVLDHYFYLSKAKIKAEMESFRGILSSQQLTEANQLPETDLQLNPLFQLYEEIADLYATANLETFAKVRTKLTTHFDQIRPTLQMELLTHLINFTIRQMKEDDQAFNQLTFELYQFGLEKNILIQDGELHDTAFLNIAVVGAKANAFEWTEQFLKKYDQYVSVTVREDVKTLALANLHFHRGFFSKAIDDMGSHHFSHPLYIISARLHGLRCYYELFLQNDSYYELLVAQGQAFERFIRRSKVYNDDVSQACLNFVSMVLRMANLRNGRSFHKTEKEGLYQKMKEQGNTISRSWLLEKIEK